MSTPDAGQQALLQGIAAATERERADAGLASAHSHDPNCRVLAYAMARLRDRRALMPAGPQMRNLLEANGINYREVAMPLDLNRLAAPVLLAFSHSDGRALALHRRWGTTVIFDPATGTCRPWRSDLALLPYAYELFAELPQPLGSVWQLLGFALRGSGLPLLLVLLSALVLALLNLSVPLLMAILVNTLLPQGDGGLILTTALVVLLIALGAAVTQSFCGLAGVRLEASLGLRLESALWRHLLRLPLPLLEALGSTEVLNRITGLSQMRQLLGNGLVTAGVSLIFSLSNLALMLHFEPRLTPMTALFTGGWVLVMGMVVLQTDWRELPLQEREAALQAMALETVQGLPQLRVSGSEPFVFSRWMATVVQTVMLLRRRDQAAHGVQILARLITPLGQLVVLSTLLGLLKPNGGDASGLGVNQLVARFVAFEAAYFAFNAQCTNVAILAATSLARFKVLAERSRVLLFASPEAGQHSSARQLQLQGAFDLQNLAVRYADGTAPLLQNLNLTVANGTYTAITGPSGCGKTTLLRCLLRLVEPSAGVISVDGVDLRQLAIRHYRQQLGVVLQNAPLPPGSIAEVVRAGRPYGEDALWHALELACVADDVARMPMRLETIVGEAGGGISGGQRQRLALARALLGQPRVLLLDEATSALDAATQAAVMHNLTNLNITRIAIAHRHSTLEAADQIAVIAEGRIRELGSFAELSGKLR